MVRRIVFWTALCIGLAAAVVLTNQILQLADLASRVNPTFGQAVFWGLIFLLTAAFAVPVVLMVRLPSALVPPESDTGPEFDRHLERLRRRLTVNPLLAGQALGTREEVEAALMRLDAVATERIRAAASRAFLTTAISQNGALDALVVLGIQARLTWDVAVVYAQRPQFRELTYLYSNVLTTAYIAGEIDDADVAEAMEPAVSAVLGSAVAVVPGLEVASNIFVNSIMSGTANAFLTLRVGIIAREHSRALTRPRRASLRRSALAQAGVLLGSIVVAGAGSVSAAIARGAGRGVRSAVAGTGKAFVGAMTGTGRRIASAGAAFRERFRGEGEVKGPGEERDQE